MKEASGELSMTAIAVVAIGAIALLFTTIIMPMIRRGLVQKTCETFGADYTATKLAEGATAGAGCFEAETGGWQCCPGTTK